LVESGDRLTFRAGGWTAEVHVLAALATAARFDVHAHVHVNVNVNVNVGSSA
jgi:hypothetical protein